MPVRPMKQRSFSRNSGVLSSGLWSQVRIEAASTRRALSAMALLAARISARLASVIGTAFSPSQYWVQRLRTSSGAPLVYCTKAPPAAWMVDIILRLESNGASSTRGAAASRSGFFSSTLAA